MTRAAHTDAVATTTDGPQTAPPVDALPLDRKRLFSAFALTPLLSGFYPAIFLAEPSIMPIGLLLAYASTALFGIPLVIYFNGAMSVSGGFISLAELRALCQQCCFMRWHYCRITCNPSAPSPCWACSSGVAPPALCSG